jgi:hypothetical protein
MMKQDEVFRIPTNSGDPYPYKQNMATSKVVGKVELKCQARAHKLYTGIGFKETICGLWSKYSKTTIRWSKVTCQRCLAKKGKGKR